MIRVGLLVDVCAILALGALGVLCAWTMRRCSTLSARNFYAPAAIGAAAVAAVLAVHAWTLAMVLAPPAAFCVSGALYGRRLRLADLGAGEELRSFEQSRRWAWQPPPARRAGERIYLRSQGELVHKRPWPAGVPYAPMSSVDDDGLRLPLGEGQHIFACGATGSGKTTSMRRVLAARTLTQNAALLILDQKGDEEDVEQMSRLAAAAEVPFVLIDPQDPASDRYQPLCGTPAQVAARAVEPIKQSEPYYYDVLRLHLDTVCRILHAADRWPPSIPFLIDACHPLHYEALVEIAQGLGGRHRPLIHRVAEHGQYVSSRKGNEDLTGGATRLQVALALASREIVTPRITPEGDAVGVGLVNALKERAVVMWKMHADAMPDEAAAMTVLALADLHDAAGQAGVPWTLMPDEFGAVIKMAASRAVAILQRGRSHGGQVIVVTQSVADPEALSGQPGLLPSLTDNFSGVVAHRQTAPESRDWLAKLMGTRALWQSTNQTTAHGSQHSGRGSARRVREFRIGSDTFAELGRGEAIIYTTLGPDPRRTMILPVELDSREPERIGADVRHSCELRVHPEERLPAATGAAGGADAPMGPDPHSAGF
ncbi:MAG TPA: TraM recognition domain-containing protein [Solirubrobacteraceae bacterium]|nr:TraM recognition domain-containing protein [Solirubrobacteraceae bacterium]